MRLSRRQFAGGGLAALASAALPGERPRPPLLVLVIAEQFRSDYLLRWQAQFAEGGFRRLLNEGSVYLDCRNLASTFTASSLATLATGCYPATHGVVADQWFDTGTNERVRAAHPLLLATTIGDQMTRSGGRVYGVAPDDVRAALVTGGSPAQVFSMDARGEFVARAGRPDGLAWLPVFQRSHDPEQVKGARWLALGAPAGSAALRVLESDPARPEDFPLLFKASPFAQASTFDLAREIVEHEKLGSQTELDCLVVITGATAALGYETGAESPLMQQLVLHLDRSIEATLEYLNQARGAGNYMLMFAGAHGAPPAGERRRALSGEEVAKRVDAALGGEAVERYVYPFLYLRPGPRTRDGRLAAGRSALKVPGVAGFFTADGDCSHHGEWRERFANSFHARRCGDLMLAYEPGYVEDYGPAHGISYGSLYNYDAQTPVIFYGPQFAARRIERTVELRDVAATIARACAFALPSSATGKVLDDAFAGAAETR